MGLPDLVNHTATQPGGTGHGPMDLNGFLKLKYELAAKYGPPLKAVRMSRSTAATFPTVPFQSNVETLYGVPIEWDESLGLHEYVAVYATDWATWRRVK